MGYEVEVEASGAWMVTQGLMSVEQSLTAG